jgi:hypothetical protein
MKHVFFAQRWLSSVFSSLACSFKLTAENDRIRQEEVYMLNSCLVCTFAIASKFARSTHTHGSNV